MLKFFVRRPITTLMFVLVWVVLGLVSFPNMNIERSPALDFPMVTATFIYPGAAPQELESQVVKRAEDAMSEVSELKRIISYVYENSALVMAEFNLGVNVYDKADFGRRCSHWRRRSRGDPVYAEHQDHLRLHLRLLYVYRGGVHPCDVAEGIYDRGADPQPYLVHLLGLCRLGDSADIRDICCSRRR